MVIRFPPSNSQVHVEIQDILFSSIFASYISSLLLLLSCYCVRSLKMLGLRCFNNHDAFISLLLAIPILKFVHTKRMGVTAFYFVAIILFIRKNFHKTIFSMHRVSVLCVFCILLYIHDNSWRLSYYFEQQIFQIWYAPSINHYCASSHPMTFKHGCEGFELRLHNKKINKDKFCSSRWSQL